MQEEVFEISLEVLDYIPAVVAGGMGISILVVMGASVIVSAFKALLRIMGR